MLQLVKGKNKIAFEIETSNEIEPSNLRRVRAFGCAALTLAYVARGSIDCYHIEDLYPWDVAAGALLIREAGGKVYKSDGQNYEIMDPKIVCAGTDQLCKEVIEALKTADTWNLRME